MARIVLTQPSPRVHTLAARLLELGHEPLAMPLSRIVDCADDASVRQVFARLAGFDWVVFVSPAAVHAASRACARWPASVGVAVVGPGSLQAIADSELAIEPARVLSPSGPRFDAEALTAMAPLDSPAGLRILVLRGAQGSEHWIDRLRERGAIVETLALYRQEPAEVPAESLRLLQAWLVSALHRPVFVVTQLAAVARLEALLAAAGLRDIAHESGVLAIHPRIAAALRDAGWTRTRAIEPGIRALELALESASDSSSPHGV